MPEPLLRYLIWPLVKFLVAFIIVQVIVAAMNWVERRLLGLIQARLGPNRVGKEFGIPWGLAQIVADPIKFILKEDIVPSSSEKVAYFLGPMLPLIPAFLVFCLIPYGPPPTFVVTHVNVGLLLILALTSTGVYGIILGGWASNNKYSLMGGLRSAAQMVSYEVPFGLSIVGVLMLCGSFDLVHIINYQASHIWNLFPQLIAAFIFLVAMNAENNRTPFDLPEAESELVAGYHTEYSGMRFSFFFLSEYANMFVVSAIATTFFLGGWLPPAPSASGTVYLAVGTLVGAAMGYGIAKRGFDAFVGAMIGGGLGALVAVFIAQPGADGAFTGKGPQLVAGAFWFFAKCFTLIFVMIWLRWTLPRYRVDQLMDLCWKKLTPLALVNLVAIGVLETRHEWMALIRGGH